MLFHFPGHWRKSCALFIEFDYGSYREPVDRRGMTHFAEHLLFCSTEEFSVSELEQRIHDCTYKMEATTSRESVRLFLNFHKNDSEAVLHLISQMLFSWRCPSSALSAQKEMLLEELEVFEQTEDHLMMRDIHRMMNVVAPCPIGTKTFIKNITPRTVSLAKKHWTNTVLAAPRQIVVLGAASDQTLNALEKMFTIPYKSKVIHEWQATHVTFKSQKRISGCLYQENTHHPLAILLDRIYYWRWQASENFHRYTTYSLGKKTGFFLVGNTIDQEKARSFFFSPIGAEEFDHMMNKLSLFFDAMLDLVDIKEALHWFNGFDEEQYGLWNIRNPLDAHAYLKSVSLQELQEFHQLLTDGA